MLLSSSDWLAKNARHCELTQPRSLAETGLVAGGAQGSWSFTLFLARSLALAVNRPHGLGDVLTHGHEPPPHRRLASTAIKSASVRPSARPSIPLLHPGKWRLLARSLARSPFPSHLEEEKMQIYIFCSGVLPFFLLRERRQYSAVSHTAALWAWKVELHFAVRKTVGYGYGKLSQVTKQRWPNIPAPRSASRFRRAEMTRCRDVIARARGPGPVAQA